MEAAYYQKLRDEKVQCLLCPHECRISPGNFGICRVRENSHGVLLAPTYEKACAVRFDPIEKKPLYHFFPGSQILSVGTVGCNLSCRFCQNWEISQCCSRDYPYLKPFPVKEALRLMNDRTDNVGIAYTYNEPTVFFEFMLALAKEVKSVGMRNVAVSNGYINPKPLEELLEYLDAFNVDLKAFTEEFYRRVTGASLEPVLQTIKAIRAKDKHLELTNLVVTGLNDSAESFEEMVKWIAGELGPGTPLHLSRYFPQYKMEAPSTPVETLLNFHEIASRHLHFVYLGNMESPAGRKTLCPSCHATLIDRTGYMAYKTGLDLKGNCRKCGEEVIKYI